MLDAFGVSEENWRDAIDPTAGDVRPTAPADFALSELPRYVGRAVVAPASDPDRGPVEPDITRGAPCVRLRVHRPRRLAARRLAVHRRGARAQPRGGLRRLPATPPPPGRVTAHPGLGRDGPERAVWRVHPPPRCRTGYRSGRRAGRRNGLPGHTSRHERRAPHWRRPTGTRSGDLGGRAPLRMVGQTFEQGVEPPSPAVWPGVGVLGGHRRRRLVALPRSEHCAFDVAVGTTRFRASGARCQPSVLGGFAAASGRGRRRRRSGRSSGGR